MWLIITLKNQSIEAIAAYYRLALIQEGELHIHESLLEVLANDIVTFEVTDS